MVLAVLPARATTTSVLALAANLAYGGPLPVTDQNPLTNGFSPPIPFSARLKAQGATDVALAFSWSSTAAIQRPNGEQLVVDLETREWRLGVEHALTDEWTLRATLPYRQHSGGNLDSAVEQWHGWFGFPDGDRPQLQRDELRVEYQRAGKETLTLAQDTSGVGDVSIDLGYRLSATPSRAASLWMTLKAPTGDAEKLNGCDCWAASVTLSHQEELGQRWSAFAELGGSYLERGELLPDLQRNWLGYGVIGIDYRPAADFAVTLQLDGHTAPYDSDLRLLGHAWLLTLGAEYRLASRWRIQAALVEDVYVESSPDVSFVVNLAASWR